MQYLKISDSFDFLNYQDRFIDTYDISNKYEITNIPYTIMLYQAGYFTIRNEQDGTLRLIFPNYEVYESLLLLYLKTNELEPSHELCQKIEEICDHIDKRDINYIIDIFNRILNECISSSSTLFNDERSVRDIIYAALVKTSSLQIMRKQEVENSRPDIIIITKKTLMLIEFQRTNYLRGPYVSLGIGMEMMKNRDIEFLFLKTPQLYKVCMVISPNEKKILPEYCKEVPNDFFI